MLIPLPIAKQITFGAIAPHGVTDLIHARQEGLVKQLYQIQAVNIIGINLLHVANLDAVINILFFLFSAVHFRHDIKLLMEKRTPILVPLLLLPFVPQCNSMDALILYMMLLHLPNHYRMSWWFLKKEKVVSSLIIGLFSLACLKGGMFIDMEKIDVFVMNMGKALVMSHIWYQEEHINKSYEKFMGYIQPFSGFIP